MIWPAPSRGERIVLTCACQGIVTWRVPLLFLYVVRLISKGGQCMRSRHALDKKLFVTLEAIAARADSQPQA